MKWKLTFNLHTPCKRSCQLGFKLHFFASHEEGEVEKNTLLVGNHNWPLTLKSLFFTVCNTEKLFSNRNLQSWREADLLCMAANGLLSVSGPDPTNLENGANSWHTDSLASVVSKTCYDYHLKQVETCFSWGWTQFLGQLGSVLEVEKSGFFNWWNDRFITETHQHSDDELRTWNAFRISLQRTL